jgi:murein DD-endopeptidase MepM/ murein hydrolase activator NlpD
LSRVQLHGRLDSISTIVRKLREHHLTTVIPVVFILALLISNALISPRYSEASLFRTNGVSGGPDTDSTEMGDALLTATYPADLTVAESPSDVVGFTAVDLAALEAPGNPLGTSLPTRDGLIIYRVHGGETLSSIARTFDVSVSTLLWANSGVRATALRPGQEIVILPVSGVLHEAGVQETIDAIAALYGVSPEVIRTANQKLASRDPEAGEKIIVPGARPKPAAKSITGNSLPSYPGYFTLPTTGWNWGELHLENAVDIANACGTSIYASAEGLVVDAGSPSAWNGGYGGFVKMEHPNGTATLYAHTSRNLVSEGDFVGQGAKIGEIGSTGKTHGPTGCHLHFEIRGARNPFAK